MNSQLLDDINDIENSIESCVKQSRKSCQKKKMYMRKQKSSKKSCLPCKQSKNYYQGEQKIKTEETPKSWWVSDDSRDDKATVKTVVGKNCIWNLNRLRKLTKMQLMRLLMQTRPPEKIEFFEGDTDDEVLNSRRSMKTTSETNYIDGTNQTNQRRSEEDVEFEFEDEDEDEYDNLLNIDNKPWWFNNEEKNVMNNQVIKKKKI